MHIEIETPPDFSFTETLNAHGWRRLAPFDCDDETATLRRAELLANGHVALLCISSGVGTILIEVDDECDADEVISRVRVMFQLDVPMDRFHNYCRNVTNLAHIPQKRQGRMLCSPTFWEDCCKVILTTNTTWNQTVGMTRRLVDAFGSPHKSQYDLKAFPTPGQLASVNYDRFEETARFGYRNLSIHSLAVSIDRGELDIEAYRNPTIDGKDLWKYMTSLRGVGPYAASCLMIYLGRYDRVNVDSWARMMVGKELDHPVSDKDVHEFFAPYGEWSGLVYHLFPWKEDEPAY